MKYNVPAGAKAPAGIFCAQFKFQFDGQFDSTAIHNYKLQMINYGVAFGDVF